MAARRGTARVGCSGWDYRDWRGVVYPADLPRRRWFEWYVERFDTVELNATFYRLPDPSTVDRWGEAAPPGFTYAVKLGQFGSHRMKLRDAERWLPNHLDRVARLGGALGPTLVQLPPRWRRDAARLDEFLAVAGSLTSTSTSTAPASTSAPPKVRWAVEVRDPSWLHDDVFEVLRRHGAALCLHDLLPDHPIERTTDWTYVRFHGPDARTEPYRGRYTGRRLWRLAARLEAWLADGADVYAYFNNDVGGAAVADATWLGDRLAERRGSAP